MNNERNKRLNVHFSECVTIFKELGEGSLIYYVTMVLQTTTVLNITNVR